MADLVLLGYGPHTLAVSNDYYVACAKGAPGRAKKLIVSINRTAGTIKPMSKVESAGSDVALENQEYTPGSGTEASSALSADTTITIDATGKQIVLRTDGSFAGDVEFDVQRES